MEEKARLHTCKCESLRSFVFRTGCVLYQGGTTADSCMALAQLVESGNEKGPHRGDFMPLLRL